MTPAQLTKIWSVIGTLVALYCLNAWLVSQGVDPISKVALLDSRPRFVSLFAIPICAALLIALCWVGLAYCQIVKGPNWAARLPVVWLENLDTSTTTGKLYQAFFAVVFLLMPCAGLIHFLMNVATIDLLRNGAASGHHFFDGLSSLDASSIDEIGNGITSGIPPSVATVWYAPNVEPVAFASLLVVAFVHVIWLGITLLKGGAEQNADAAIGPANNQQYRDSQLASLSVIEPHAAADLPTLRAAYSDRTATLMAFFAAFAYRDPLTPSGPATLPAELAALGFQSVTYFASELIDGLALIAEGPTLNVVSFRGTRSFKNWRTNITLWPKHVLLKAAGRNLWVHEGFYHAFVLLSQGGLSKAIDALREKTGGRVPIYVTGHSLGGAVAQVATAVYAGDDLAACYTFGSPRVGTSALDRWVKAPSYRVINYADIVPQIPPPFAYRHAGDPRYLPEAGDASPFRFEPSPLVRLWQLLQACAQLVTTWSFLGVRDHNMDLYAKRLDEVARARTTNHEVKDIP